jgi:hypothetical protein
VSQWHHTSLRKDVQDVELVKGPQGFQVTEKSIFFDFPGFSKEGKYNYSITLSSTELTWAILASSGPSLIKFTSP